MYAAQELHCKTIVINDHTHAHGTRSAEKDEAHEPFASSESISVQPEAAKDEEGSEAREREDSLF